MRVLAVSSGRTLRAGISGRALRPGRACVAGWSLDALDSLDALRPLVAGVSLRAGRPGLSDWALDALGTLRPGISRVTFRPRDCGVSSRRPLRPLSALDTLRSGIPGIALVALRSADPGGDLYDLRRRLLRDEDGLRGRGDTTTSAGASCVTTMMSLTASPRG